MKLLIFTQTVDYTDPILGFFHRWIVEFSQKFEQVYVICLKEGLHTLPKNVHVYSLGKEEGENRIKYCIRFYRYCTHIFFVQKVSVAFFHMGAIYNILAFPFFLVRAWTHTTFIWWKTHGKLNWLGRIAMHGVDEIVTAGDFSFNGNTHKVRVVGHAIDTDVLTRSDRSLEQEKCHLLSVGRITPIKKNEISLDVVLAYRERYGEVLPLDLYGPITDTAYKTVLDTKITTNGLQTSVTFQGPKTPQQMLQVYQAYDILLHPSYEAGFDKVVLEAMACGVIPLTSIRSFESILQGYGLYVGPNDVEAYVTRVHEIVTMPLSQRSKMVTELREIVVRNHSIATLPERIFGVL